jgi:hypothetical protein
LTARAATGIWAGTTWPARRGIGRRSSTPSPGPDSRLRWDLAQLHAALNVQRQRLTWAALAAQIGCTPSRLTNLRTAHMALTMRVTQWLRKPAAEFIHPASSQHRAELR